MIKEREESHGDFGAYAKTMISKEEEDEQLIYIGIGKPTSYLDS